ncbi:RNA ligase/cyclic nucleotide phosphodiesterase [Mycena capillaripes]|nr:RNA ligase/cyclic nucleotide phosphodiesterase [Mycena capillaripes]
MTSNLPVDSEGPKYPPGVPSKFDSDGNVQRFPGNTIVSHLSPTSEPELYNSMLALYDTLKNSHLSHLYALLPPSSWHMTVFEGVCDQVHDLSITASLEECTALYQEKLSSFDLQCDPPYYISITGFDPLETGIGIHLEPSTTEGDARIRGLRDWLSDVLHIRAKEHKTYVLHFSMAYLLRILTKEQDQELRKLLMDHLEGMPKQCKLGAPEFCTFEDMFAFKRLFYLKNQ